MVYKVFQFLRIEFTFELWHSFALKVPGIFAVSLMDPHHTASQFWHLVWNRFNMYRIGFERPAPMMWWCDCGSSPHGILLWNADVLPTHRCVHKSLDPMHREKGHDTAYKMAMTLEKQNEDHRVRVSNWLLLSCGVNLSYQICGRWACCSRTDAWVRDDILRSMTTNFHFERPASCLFNIGDVAWSLKSAHSSHPRKAVMSELCLVPLFSSHVDYMEYNL